MQRTLQQAISDQSTGHDDAGPEYQRDGACERGLSPLPQDPGVDGEKKPQLEAQVRLFRDGKEVYEGPQEQLSAAKPPSDPKRLPFSGGIQLSQIAPGRYTLQIVVADNNRYDKYRMAAQAIDFEVKK